MCKVRNACAFALVAFVNLRLCMMTEWDVTVQSKSHMTCDRALGLGAIEDCIQSVASGRMPAESDIRICIKVSRRIVTLTRPLLPSMRRFALPAAKMHYTSIAKATFESGNTSNGFRAQASVLSSSYAAFDHHLKRLDKHNFTSKVEKPCSYVYACICIYIYIEREIYV